MDADSFQLYSVVATAALVRLCLTSQPTWNDTDGDWDVNDFVNGLLESVRAVAEAQLGYEAGGLGGSISLLIETSTDLYYLRELFGNGHEKRADRPPTTGDQMLEESDSEAETCDIDEPFGDASGGKD
ncbi:uncharacterized protein BXZ73DRAFT_81250 [Epithele typhae]|uniref:uncharacterized protein n=1 Tax=Epithele typhae TaxID=378194 RepID=UPI002008D34C|nr:uncharacterized protein BXZ73DRAFT_81250 [Epithele typhae]KAH9915776.1 hypothetical protein BXZ73DRAFT_81250 [Epithele typhae]